MSGSVNKVILVGNVVADPEIRRTKDGRAIANLRMATNEAWRDKVSGEKREKVEYHRVAIFSEPLCRLVEQYVKKGSKLYIEGQLATREWEDQQGAKRQSTEIVLQGFGGALTMLGDPQRKDEPRESGGQRGRTTAAPATDDYGDDIPFAPSVL